jgi:Ras GTPase-activating protein 3
MFAVSSFNFRILFYARFNFALQDLQTNRTLTLISKTIQSLGNLVSSRSAQQHAKEEFTAELYKKFCTEKHVEAVKKFLDAISSKGSRDEELIVKREPILLKHG